jgi:hypothetical protein
MVDGKFSFANPRQPRQRLLSCGELQKLRIDAIADLEPISAANLGLHSMEAGGRIGQGALSRDEASPKVALRDSAGEDQRNQLVAASLQNLQSWRIYIRMISPMRIWKRMIQCFASNPSPKSNRVVFFHVFGLFRMTQISRSSLSPHKLRISLLSRASLSGICTGRKNAAFRLLKRQ